MFELYAGRESRPVPADLPIEYITPTSSIKNRDWHTTSEDLIDALGAIGLEYGRPKAYAKKIDLSHTDAHSALHNPALAAEEAKANIALALGERGLRTNIKEILVRYLRQIDPFLEYHDGTKTEPSCTTHIDEGLRNFSEGGDLQWLQRYGWTIKDLMTWAWILKASSPDQATFRLAHATKLFSKRKSSGHAVPLTIFLFLLRRQNITASGLRRLLLHAWNIMEEASRTARLLDNTGQESKELASERETFRKIIPSPKDNSSGIAEDIFMIMIIRLLRHARRVWPAACESITLMFCRYVNGLNLRESNCQDQAQLNFMYNTILKLLSMPASLQPFVSAMHQQRAQFAVLRRMNEFKPPLVVDRRGYRAVTTMQLMHKKTLREREWALLKSKTWPPWKQDRLGTDVAIGPEYGISRAKEVMDRAEQAGYENYGWERAASILAGWDTDGSPTIQSRRVFRSDGSDDKKINEHAKVWTNRVRATRTLNEAWALFLQYKDEHLPPREIVYLAMLEKIVYDAKRRKLSEAEYSSRISMPEKIAGDGPEVFAESISPLETIYVRTKPPCVDEFYNLMTEDGIISGGRLLAFLLTNAPSFAFGLKVLTASSLPLKYKAVLLGEPTEALPVAQYQGLLQEVPPYVFESFIALLIKFVQTSSKDDDTDGSFDFPMDILIAPALVTNPLLHAFNIMHLRKPFARRPWILLLGALSRSNLIVDNQTSRITQNVQDVLSWHTIVRLLRMMESLNVGLDLEMFMKACVGLEKAVLAAVQLLQSESRQNVSDRHISMAQNILANGLAVLKLQFKDTVGSDSMLEEIPKTLLAEKNAIDEEINECIEQSNGRVDDADSADPSENKSFLPPSCLLPRLLEAPRPAYIHQFVRVLGLLCDFDGLLDLIEWMAIHADELKAQADEQRSGSMMFRRCLIAARVFLERSWIYYDVHDREKHVLIERNLEPAPKEIWQAIKNVIEENSKWGGWPSDEEVEEYISKGRFI